VVLQLAKEITNIEQQTLQQAAMQRQRQANNDFNRASRMLRHRKGRRCKWRQVHFYFSIFVII